MAEAIVRAQARAIAVGVEAEAIQLVTSQRSVACQYVDEIAAALARYCFAQGMVVAPEISRRELRRLVVDDVGGKRRQRFHAQFRPGDAPILLAGRVGRLRLRTVADRLKCARAVPP